MKIKCDKCGKDISAEVDKAFESYNCGRLICPHCQSRQRRYISESDLLIYFGISAMLYFILITLVYLMFNYVAIDFTTIGIIIIILVANYLVFKYIDRYIYEKAPLKSNLKNRAIDEDIEAVSKRMKWQFFAFIVVALMLVGQPNTTLPYFFLLIAFIIIVAIKIKLSIDNETRHRGNG